MNIPILVVALALFTQKAYFMLDPDFGWHIKLGELYLQNKKLFETDPFSYTMSSFKYIDHEWATNIFMYYLYENFGKISLVVISLLIVFLTLLVINKFTPKEHSQLMTIIFLGGVYFFFGVRPQILSWLFFAITIHELLKERFIFFPILFFIWANLHGSFSAGIATVFIYIIASSLREKKIDQFKYLALFLSIIVTFINPYRAHIWREVWMTTTDSALKWRVTEWTPSIFTSSFFFFFILTLGSVIVYMFYKKIKLEVLTLFIFWGLQSLLAARHIPLFIIASMPVLIEGFDLMKEKVGKIKHAKKRLDFTLNKILPLFLLILFCLQLMFNLLFDPKITESFYPVESVNYLNKHSTEGNLFSLYGWGGYLLWKYPDHKLFIDGRMPSWVNKNASETQSKKAMDDYLEIIKNEDEEYKEYFEKYNIKIVLLSKEQIYINFTNVLKENGWQVLYEDENEIMLRYIN